MKSHRIAIIADIHGILPPLKTVIADIQRDPPDQIIVAGDFLGGPQPSETLSVLQENKCLFILGNGEVNMLKMHHRTAPEVWWSHDQFSLGRWVYRKLDQEHFKFLEELPEQYVAQMAGCTPFRVVHGSPWDINKLIFPDKEPEALARALGMIPEGVLVFAHTHLPDVFYKDQKMAVNPGSVGNNLNGDTRASYATLTWDGNNWQPQLHHIFYDHDEVIHAFQKTGFLEDTRPLARAFLESILTGENTGLEYILYAFDMAKKAGYRDLEAVPDDIWIDSEANFPWRFDL